MEEKKVRIWIKRIVKRNDRQAANSLITCFYDRLMKYVQKQIIDAEMAKDLVQEIFITMLRSISLYDYKKSSYFTWLCNIANNKIIDYYRSKYYHQSLLTITTEFLEEKAICEDFVLEKIEQDEKYKEILEVLNMLDFTSQQILRMKIFGNLKFCEISMQLGRKENTVKTQYYTAIKFIRKKVEENNSGDRY